MIMGWPWEPKLAELISPSFKSGLAVGIQRKGATGAGEPGHGAGGPFGQAGLEAVDFRSVQGGLKGVVEDDALRPSGWQIETLARRHAGGEFACAERQGEQTEKNHPEDPESWSAGLQPERVKSGIRNPKSETNPNDGKGNAQDDPSHRNRSAGLQPASDVRQPPGGLKIRAPGPSGFPISFVCFVCVLVPHLRISDFTRVIPWAG
jgi:hypothetical protein